MNDAIRAAIEKTLPGEIAKIALDELNAAQSLREQVKELKEHKASLMSHNSELQAKAQEVTNKAARLDTRERELEEKAEQLEQQRWAIEKAEIYRDTAQARSAELREIVSEICRGPVAKRTIHEKRDGWQDHPTKDSSGYPTTTGCSQNETVDKTITEEGG